MRKAKMNEQTDLKQTILLVDDDPNFRHLLSEILKPCGFNIVEAPTAEDALEELNGRVCMAIVDFRLPKMDGMTFVTKMREVLPETPVVFVSASFCDPRTFNWLRNILKVSLILQKPIQPTVFLQQLEGLLPKIETRPRSRSAETLVNFTPAKVSEAAAADSTPAGSTPAGYTPAGITPPAVAAKNAAKASAPLTNARAANQEKASSTPESKSAKAKNSKNTEKPSKKPSAKVAAKIAKEAKTALKELTKPEANDADKKGTKKTGKAASKKTDKKSKKDLSPVAEQAGDIEQIDDRRVDDRRVADRRVGDRRVAEAEFNREEPYSKLYEEQLKNANLDTKRFEQEEVDTASKKFDLSNFDEAKAEQNWRQLPQDLTAPEEETAEHLLVQLQQMRRKLETEARIRAAQLELRKAIPPDWAALSSNIGKLRMDMHNPNLLKICLDMSHRLRGTAGSLGLSRVSSCAGKIENCLAILNPNEDQEFLWAAIARALAEGETSLRLAESLERNEVVTEGFNVGHVLILSEEAKFTKAVSQLNPYVNAEFSFANSATDAVMKASTFRFDSAIIDLGIVPAAALPQLTRELRMISNNANLALGCFSTSDNIPVSSLLAYLGISTSASFPVDNQKLEEVLRQLAVSRQAQQPRVLTVDDDKVLTNFIQTVLQNIGMNVNALNEPIHIMDALEKVQPDLVLLDVMMPGMSGFDVCRMLREHERWHTVPILFLTSKSNSEGRAAAFQAGGSDLLSKPIISEELIARVRAQIDHSKAKRQSIKMDGATGTLKKDMFLLRAEEMFESAAKKRHKFVFALARINAFDQLANFGLFSQMNVISVIGKLLCSRFTAEVLRGRWDDKTFAIAFDCNSVDDARAALESFSQEVKQMAFMLPFANKLDLTVHIESVVHGPDGNSLEELVKKAEHLQG